MVYYLSKIFWVFAQPSSLLAALLAVSLVLLVRGRYLAGRRLLGFSLASYLVLGISPLAHLLTLPLENRFARPDKTALSSGVDAIVVLGGGVDTTVSKARGVATLNESGERVVEGLMLAKAYPDARLVISGASANLFYSGVSDGAAIGEIFASLLENPKRVIIEDRSLNTWQNARFTRQILKPKPGGDRVVLVTSAFHMPRAVGCFRKAGMNVVAWPVDYRTRGSSDIWRFFDKPSEGLRRADLIFREWIGLAAYRVTGRTDALFPAP